MLSRAAAIAAGTAALLGGLTVPAAADGHSSADPDCGGSTVVVTVCAAATSSTPGSFGGSGTPAAHHGQSGSGTPKCTYSKLNPQPPANNLAMQDGKRRGGKGAVYQVWCDSGRFGVVWVPDGAAPVQPAVDPQMLARRAADSMTLRGPDIASPRAAGRYLVGMPMWMWVDQTPTTYGPQSARATTGGVTVTATAKVSSVSWNMGDRTSPVACTGPGTPYTASAGKATSPDCGHLYATTPSTPDGRFPLTATSTWTITWHVDGNETDAGQWTETRTSNLGVHVSEAQVVNQ
jgi:hypothetical protein